MIEGQNEVVALAAMKLAHHGLLGAVGDAQDAAFPAPVGLGAKHLHFHAVAVHGGAHAVGGDVDVLVGARQRRVGHHKTVAIAMANQAAGDHVRPARPRGHGIRDSGLGARRRLRGRAVPATVRWKSRRAGERARRYPADQREVVLLQINDAAMAREIFQRALELARLARPQAELHHQLAKPERLARLALKDLENLLRRWKFAHGFVFNQFYHSPAGPAPVRQRRAANGKFSHRLVVS